MASAMVGSPISSCQCSTGSWLVTMVERASVAVVHDLQQVAPLLGGERREAPVVEDQELHAARLFSSRAYRPSPRASARASNSRGTR